MTYSLTKYAAFREFDDGQWTFCGDLQDFDGAVDDFIEAREEGANARVKAIHLAGDAMADVTQDAIKRAHEFWAANRVEAPAWAMPAAAVAAE